MINSVLKYQFFDKDISDHDITQRAYLECSFKNISISKKKFCNVNFVNCSFNDCTFDNNCFFECSFKHCIFNNCSFNHDDFDLSFFESVFIINSTFEKSLLENCSFLNTKISETVARKTSFKNSSLDVFLSGGFVMHECNVKSTEFMNHSYRHSDEDKAGQTSFYFYRNHLIIYGTGMSITDWNSFICKLDSTTKNASINPLKRLVDIVEYCEENLSTYSL